MNIKSLSVGFLANALGLLTFILLIYAGIATVGIFYTTVDQLARANADNVTLTTESTPGLIAQTLAGSFRNMISSIWSMRLGFLIFGILGVFAAWSHAIGLAIDPKRVWYFSFVMLYLVIAVALITWGLTQQEYISLWMAEEPELYRWNDVLRRSYSTDVSVALILALTITYPMWLLWQWWYTRLIGKFGDGIDSSAKPDLGGNAMPTPVPAADHRAYAERLQWLKSDITDLGQRDPSPTHVSATPMSPALRKLTTWGFILPVALIFVISLLAYSPTRAMQNQVAVHLQHNTAFLNADTKAALSFPVTVEPGDGRIRIVNVKGLGTVGIFLSPTDDIVDSVKSIDAWTFEYRVDEYIYNEFELTGIAPGAYLLHFVQASGWGWFEFTLSQGGGTRSLLLAALLGFFVACLSVAGLLLIASLSIAVIHQVVQ